MIIPGIDYSVILFEKEWNGKRYRLTIGDKFYYYDRIGYKPYKEEAEFHADPHRFKVVYGARRVGKSMMAARDFEPFLLMPITRVWIVAPEYEIGGKEFSYMWDGLINKFGLETKKKQFNEEQGRMFIHTLAGSELKVKSITRPTSVLGQENDAVIMSEAAQQKHSIWERYTHATLATRKGYCDFATTPVGYNWVYKLWQINDAYWKGFGPIPYEASPYHDPEVLEEAKKNLSKEAFAEQYLGLPTHFTGRIYTAFNEKINIVPTQPIPKEWKLYRGIDPGCSGMFFCTFLAVDYDANIHIYNEYYSRETSTPEHIESIKERSRDDYFEYTAIDPSASQEYYDLNEAGIICTPVSRKNVKRFKFSRVLLVDRLLRSKKLFVQEHCKETIFGFLHHRWAETKGEDVERKPAEDRACHPMDAVEYAIWLNPQAPKGKPVSQSPDEMRAEYEKKERERIWENIRRQISSIEQPTNRYLGDF